MFRIRILIEFWDTICKRSKRLPPESVMFLGVLAKLLTRIIR